MTLFRHQHNFTTSLPRQFLGTWDICAGKDYLFMRINIRIHNSLLEQVVNFRSIQGLEACLYKVIEVMKGCETDASANGALNEVHADSLEPTLSNAFFPEDQGESAKNSCVSALTDTHLRGCLHSASDNVHRVRSQLAQKAGYSATTGVLPGLGLPRWVG